MRFSKIYIKKYKNILADTLKNISENFINLKFQEKNILNSVDLIINSLKKKKKNFFLWKWWFCS